MFNMMEIEQTRNASQGKHASNCNGHRREVRALVTAAASVSVISHALALLYA